MADADNSEAAAAGPAPRNDQDANNSEAAAAGPAPRNDQDLLNLLNAPPQPALSLANLTPGTIDIITEAIRLETRYGPKLVITLSNNGRFFLPPTLSSKLIDAFPPEALVGLSMNYEGRNVNTYNLVFSRPQ